VITPGKGNCDFGLSIMREGSRTFIGHGGGISGFNSALAYYPKDDVVIVALSNLSGGGADMTEKLREQLNGN
jgi:hypothetical protein